MCHNPLICKTRLTWHLYLTPESRFLLLCLLHIFGPSSSWVESLRGQDDGFLPTHHYGKGRPMPRIKFFDGALRMMSKNNVSLIPGWVYDRSCREHPGTNVEVYLPLPRICTHCKGLSLRQPKIFTRRIVTGTCQLFNASQAKEIPSNGQWANQPQLMVPSRFRLVSCLSKIQAGAWTCGEASVDLALSAKKGCPDGFIPREGRPCELPETMANCYITTAIITSYAERRRVFS